MDYKVTINDADIDRVESGFAAHYGYQDLIPDPNFVPDPDNPQGVPELVPNPEAKRDFVVRLLHKFLIESVTSNEIKVAVELARRQAEQGAIKEGAIKP